MEDETSGTGGQAARFPFDPVYKALCCHPATVADILRTYLAAPAGPLDRRLLDGLDLGTLRKVPAEWVTRDFRLRRGDQVWRVDFTAAAQRAGYPKFLLVHLEFQSRNDEFMALRYLEYDGELYRALRVEGAIAAGEPCLILCVLLHNGRSRWTAATTAADLLALPPALGAAAVPPGLAAFHPWGYHPIDFAAHAGRAHISGSVLSMMIGIEFARRRSDLVAPLWETARRVRDPGLRDAVARWLTRLRERYNLDLPGMEELLAMDDVTVLTSRLDETIEEWRREAVAEGRSEGISEGRRAGISEGRRAGISEGRRAGISEGRRAGISEGRRAGLARQRALIRRMAGTRFGGEAAARVGALIEGVNDWDVLESVGDAIIRAGEGNALVGRVEELVRRRS